MLRHLFLRSVAGPRAALRAGAARLAMLASVAGFAVLAAPAPVAAQAAQPAGAAAAATAVAPQPVDRIVAVVNSEAITASELALRMKVAERQLRAQNIEAPPTDALEKQVLERMIVDRAQLQAARDAGIRVDNAQVDQALGSIAQENRLTVAQLRERVERDGTSFERFREDVREEIIRRRLREREIDSRVQVSDADVDAFLASQPKGSEPAP